MIKRPLLTAAALALALVALICAAVPAFAAPDASPVGLWQTIDDHTGKPRGEVRIFERDGKLYGRIERSLDPHEADDTCDACTDERKGQKVVGMTIIRAMVARNDGTWSGGDILDPESGSVYRCKFELRDNARTLVVRGYLGIALFGRSQTWVRIE